MNNLLKTIHTFDKAALLKKTTTICTDEKLNSFEEVLVDGEYVRRPLGNKLDALTSSEVEYYLRDALCKVTQGLYISNALAASRKDVMKANNITHVMCLAPNVGAKFPNEFQYVCYDIHDTPDAPMLGILPEAVAFIHNAIHNDKGEVLVHCYQGISRSAAVVIAYLMKEQFICYDKALNTLQQARPIVRPNEGFVDQLRRYESQLGLTAQGGSMPALTEEDEEEED